MLASHSLIGRDVVNFQLNGIHPDFHRPKGTLLGLKFMFDGEIP
jgi:hypothetical protein